jgi:hypothetical protein
MKKLMILGTLTALVVFASLQKNGPIHSGNIRDAKASLKAIKSNSKLDTSKIEAQDQSQAANETIEADQYEDLYQDLSSQKIEEKIKQFEASENERDLFGQLNKNPNDESLKAQVTQSIREKRALNKILLERKLKETEEAYL